MAAIPAVQLGSAFRNLLAGAQKWQPVNGQAGHCTAEREKAQAIKKMKSIERTRYENSCYAADDDDNIVFEDFARLRLNEPE